MPHCVVELSQDLASHQTALVQDLFKVAAASGLFKQDYDIKVRSQVYTTYTVGNTSDSFVYVGFSLLAGRTPEQKKTLSEAIKTLLITRFPDQKNLSLSVNVIDMDAGSYWKN